METPPPKPPIFIWEPGDLLAFGSLEDAEAYLEPADVRRSDFGVVLDSTGRRLRAGVVTRARRILLCFRVRVDAVQLTMDEPEHARPEELREILVKYLQRCNHEGCIDHVPPLDSMSIEDLVAVAWKAIV